jgi:hypothetical protein
MSSTKLSKMLFDNTNFRTSYVASAPAPARARARAPAPVNVVSRRNINPAFHLSRFISNATNTGPCKACGS